MKFQKCDVEGACVIEPEPHIDDRGRFLRSWCFDDFSNHGIEFHPVQSNMGFSRKKGTMRGLHYQVVPALEAKLVRCTRGLMFDIVADLREGSATYLRWYGTNLSPENGKMLYVPEGCAHGCLSLEDETEFYYLASARFAPDCARGRRFDDPLLAIDWPHEVVVASEQDRTWPLLTNREE